MILCLSNVLFEVENVLLSSAWRMFCVIETINHNKIINIRQEKRGKRIFLCIAGNEKYAMPLLYSENPYLVEQQVYRFCMNILLSKGALHLHSSFVLYRDKAILFTGPSGIGKTTQAELWRDYRGGLIVNGDASLIRKVDDVWQAFGTPVHGSSPYCENRQAPIAALIALRQGKENRMERLDGYEALRFCLPELYRPKMEPETEEVFWNTVDAFFSEIPVYLLTCRPDEDAVALTENTIFQTEN